MASFSSTNSVRNTEMKNLCFILFCAILISSALTKSVRIRSGENASIRDFPFIVQLRLFSLNSFFCAGSIISNNFILTAAHCTFQLKRGITDLWVIAGSEKLSDNDGTSYYVKKVHIHPEFEGLSVGTQSRHNDIAVLVIRGFIVFNERINKIDLPTQDTPAESVVTLCGWGGTSFPLTQYSDALQKVNVKVLEQASCSIPTSEDQMCTFTQGKGAMHGDSGGPVISNGKLVGIISYGFPWIQDQADRHSNIFKHLDFIYSVIYS